MLTLQRLGGGLSLTAVIKVVQEFGKHLLPDNKRVRERDPFQEFREPLASKLARVLPLKAAELFCQQDLPIARRAFAILVRRTKGLHRGWHHRHPLRPTDELSKAFPPATNQHGETVWPVLLMLVAHELQSGCALIPEIGAMYGEKNTSEAKLAPAARQATASAALS